MAARYSNVHLVLLFLSLGIVNELLHSLGSVSIELLQHFNDLVE